MKRLIVIIIAGLLLAACAPAPAAPADSSAPQTAATSTLPAVDQQTTPVPAVEGTLSTEYDDATNVRNQLAFGILKLEGTAQAVTGAQAKELLPLWQAMLALSGSSTAVPEEMTAVQDQIAAALTADQLAAISAMKITNTALSAFYAEKGIVLPTPVPGVTKVPGSGKNLPEADRLATRAAREASGAATGTGQASKTLLYDEVVKLLTERAAQ